MIPTRDTPRASSVSRTSRSDRVCAHAHAAASASRATPRDWGRRRQGACPNVTALRRVARHIEREKVPDALGSGPGSATLEGPGGKLGAYTGNYKTRRDTERLWPSSDPRRYQCIERF